MDLYTGYAVQITPDGGTATMISGITQQAVRVGAEHTAEATAGSEYARHGAINQMRPGGSFTSYAITDVLDLLGLRGACLAGGASPGAEFFQRALARCGTVQSTAVHRKIIIPNGLAVARGISVSHRADATINVEVLAYYDGTNNPLIISENIAAPTGIADTARYTLGPIEVAGIAIEGNLSVDIDFGNGAATDGGDSEPYDTHIQIPQIVPTITIRGRDVAKFGASGIGLVGAHGTHANTSIVLRKRTAGTASFSDDADNIEFTADCIASFDDGFTASGNQRGEASLTLTALDDGTNAPLVIDTAYDPTPL